MRPSVDLTPVGTPDLEQLLGALRAGRLCDPLDRTSLHAAGLGHLGARLGNLSALGAASLRAVVEAALAERSVVPSCRAHLVWTGPEAPVSTARDTAVVLRELFSTAQKRVLVAGYRFTQGRDILRPLHESMTTRGVSAAFFIDLDRGTPSEVLRRFLEENWPFGAPFPDLYYDPRTAGPGASVIFHAKCVVVDEHRSLVTSANFTYSGQSQNVEVGVLLEDASFAKTLAAQLGAATAAGIFLRWLGP